MSRPVRPSRRDEALFRFVFLGLLGLIVVTVVYFASMVANGGLYARSSAATGRLPALLDGARKPLMLGPAALHPVPPLRFPNYQPRHAS